MSNTVGVHSKNRFISIATKIRAPPVIHEQVNMTMMLQCASLDGAMDCLECVSCTVVRICHMNTVLSK